MEANRSRSLKILAVSSGGGHWVQLLRVRPAFAECQVTYATVNPSYQSDVGSSRFYAIADATRWSKLGLLRLAAQIIGILLWERPDVVISTGAAPGFFAVMFGKWMGARTIWIDSMANVDELSLSGQRAGKYADLWLTQWPHLAEPEGPQFAGRFI